MNNEGVNGDKRMYRTATTTLGISNVYFVISRIRTQERAYVMNKTHLTIEWSGFFNFFSNLSAVCLKLHLKVVMDFFVLLAQKTNNT